MRFLNKMVPSLIKQLDRHLLLHHRLIWETKFHYVLLFSITACLGATLIGFIYPISLSTALPSPRAMGIIAAVPTFIIFCYWGFLQTRYGIERNYGQLFSGLGQWRFLIYFSSILLFTLPPLLFGNLIDHRIANVVSDQELETDISALNAGHPFLITERLIQDYQVYSHPYRADKTEGNIFRYLNCAIGSDKKKNCSYFDFHYFGMDEKYTPFYEQTHDMPHTMREYFQNEKGAYTDAHRTYIENFVTTFNKYGANFSIKASVVYQVFKGKRSASQNLTQQKKFVKDQIVKIKVSKTPLSEVTMSMSIKISLIFVFFFSILMYVLKSVNLKDFLIASVSVVAVLFSTVLITGFWDSFARRVLKPEYLFLALSGSAFLISIYKTFSTPTVYSRFTTICLIGLTYLGALLPLWVITSLKLTTDIDYLNRPEDLVTIVLAGMLLHYFIGLPFLRKQFLRMKALPKN